MCGEIKNFLIEKIQLMKLGTQYTCLTAGEN